MNCRRVLVFLTDNDLKKEPTIETNMIQRLRIGVNYVQGVPINMGIQ